MMVENMYSIRTFSYVALLGLLLLHTMSGVASISYFKSWLKALDPAVPRALWEPRIPAQVTSTCQEGPVPGAPSNCTVALAWPHSCVYLLCLIRVGAEP